MKIELEDSLQAEFPTLYANTNYPAHFACGDGWYELIRNLSLRIIEIDPFAVSIGGKEKHGMLSYSIWQSNNDAVFDAISEAEELSKSICELCGKPSHTSTDSDFLCMSI